MIRRHRKFRSRRKYTVIKRLVVRGFDVRLLDNHDRYFKYEWQLRPLTSTALRCTWNQKLVIDPTSHSTRRMCLIYAKDAALGLSRPKISYSL